MIHSKIPKRSGTVGEFELGHVKRKFIRAHQYIPDMIHMEDGLSADSAKMRGVVLNRFPVHLRKTIRVECHVNRVIRKRFDRETG